MPSISAHWNSSLDSYKRKYHPTLGFFFFSCIFTQNFLSPTETLLKVLRLEYLKLWTFHSYVVREFGKIQKLARPSEFQYETNRGVVRAAIKPDFKTELGNQTEEACSERQRRVSFKGERETDSNKSRSSFLLPGFTAWQWLRSGSQQRSSTALCIWNKNRKHFSQDV